VKNASKTYLCVLYGYFYTLPAPSDLSIFEGDHPGGSKSWGDMSPPRWLRPWWRERVRARINGEVRFLHPLNSEV